MVALNQWKRLSVDTPSRVMPSLLVFLSETFHTMWHCHIIFMTECTNINPSDQVFLDLLTHPRYYQGQRLHQILGTVQLWDRSQTDTHTQTGPMVQKNECSLRMNGPQWTACLAKGYTYRYEGNIMKIAKGSDLYSIRYQATVTGDR